MIRWKLSKVPSYIFPSVMLPYWKKFLTEMHARGILYSYATEKEKLMILNKVKKEKK